MRVCQHPYNGGVYKCSCLGACARESSAFIGDPSRKVEPRGIEPDRPSQTRALDTQVGGSHYKTKGIQPVEYAYANNLGFFEGSVVKYVSRWQDKGGVADLRKAKHFLEMLIELETGKADAIG